MKTPPSRRREEIDEEIKAHLAMAQQDREQRGQTPDDAAVDARREFGNLELVREDTRGIWSGVWLEQVLQDVRYGARQLIRNRAFTLVAVLSLALGIGTSITIFSALDAVVLRVLPYREPDRLVEAFQSYFPRVGMNKMPVSVPNYVDWLSGTRAFEGLAAVEFTSLNLTGDGGPERIRAAAMTANTFAVLGTDAVVGRVFRPGYDSAQTPVAVLSYSLWQRRFDGNEDVIGRTLVTSDQTYTVIGVMPKDFRFPIGWLVNDVELWTPLTFATPERADRGNMAIDTVVGRLKANVTMTEAQADLDVVAGRLAQLYPRANKDWGAYLMPLNDRGVSDWRLLFTYLSVAAGLVLLIGCANVAKLLLARGLDRRRELALRTALGARRGRIVRQLLTEGVLLALVGGAAGILIAAWGVRTLVSLTPVFDMQDMRHATVNLRALTFALGLCGLTGFLFSLFPALSRSKGLHETTVERTPISAGRKAQRAQVVLAATELALTVPLLLAAGTLVRSFHHYTTGARGFVSDNVLAMRLTLPAQKYPKNPQVASFFENAVSEIAAIPGVVSTAVGSSAPLEDAGDIMQYAAVGQPPPAPGKASTAELVSVSADYFRATGIPLRQGRSLGVGDQEGAPRVALVSESLARHAFPSGNAVGAHIQLLGDINLTTENGGNHPVLDIVGVVGDTGEYYVYDPPTPVIYVPLDQSPRRGMSLLVKTAGDPTSIVPDIRRRILKVDPDQPAYNIQTLDKLVTDHHAVFRLDTVLLGGFASVALVLTLIGVYGVMAYVVGQRVREFAVRMALGATGRQILGLVMTKGTWLSAGGVTAGLLVAWPAMTLFANVLKRSENLDLVPTGPWLVAGGCGAIITVALLACLVPARRATTVPPMEVLRMD